MTKYIYIMISRTPTKFGLVLRKFGGMEYNHCAVSLDSRLDGLYSFARRQHRAVLVGGLVREDISRYTLNKASDVEVVIFRLPVSEEQYSLVEQEIDRIEHDGDYMYNFISVFSYPITRGMTTYKAYTCIEFSMHILQLLSVPLDKPCCRYRPDDLISLLGDSVFYRGNLLDYRAQEESNAAYFSPMTRTMLCRSVLELRRIFVRSLFYSHR